MKKIVIVLSVLFSTLFVFLLAPQKVEASSNTYSTNVSVETDASAYYCAEGQKFKIKITVNTDEVSEIGYNKYIGYLAFLKNGWQQIASWYMYIGEGGETYTITLNSSAFEQYYNESYLLFTASVFPVDNFTTGASLCDRFFTVSFLDASFGLTYNANGGSCNVTSGSIIYNCPYGDLPTPTRTGYTFTGWYTNSNGGAQIKSDTLVSVTKDQTLYAHWSPNNYTVTYNANGGTVSPPNKSITYNNTYGTLSTPTKRGYTFQGWYTSLNGGTRVYESTKMTKAYNHTLYAHWRINDYTVTFNANGGTVSTPSKSITYNSSYGTLPTPTKTGYTFQGWYTAASGGNKRTSDSTMTTADDHILYAHWQPKTYTVTFDANGGNLAAGKKSANVTYNSIYGTLPTPTRTGYVFQGWYTAKTGGDKIVKTSKVTVAKNQTLYARWAKGTSKVTFNANGGKCKTGSKAVTYRNTYGTLPTPTRSNYKFLGWYTKKSGGSKVSASTTVNITSNQTLYAHWQVVKPATTKLTVKLNSVNSVKLSWKKVSGAKGYIVYRSTSKTGKYKKCAEVKGSLTYTDKKLKTGKTYYYRVMAYKKIDNKNVYGKQSNIVKKKIIGSLKQPVQKEIVYNKEDKTYTISWSTVKNAQKIEIFRSVDGAVAKKVGTVSAKQKSATYSYEKLEKGHKYSFAVRAYYEVDGKKIYSGLSNGCAFTKNR